MRASRHTLGGLALVIAAAGMATSGITHAGKFYKWVDENGVTHYGEQAPKEGSATKIKVSDTTSSDADAEIERLEKSRQAARAPKEDESTPAGVTPPPAGTDEANNKACEQHRKNLETLKSGRRVRAIDESGKPRALNEDEIKAQLELAESELKRCEQLQKVKDAANKGKPGYP